MFAMAVEWFAILIGSTFEMSRSTVVVSTEEAIGRISPMLYGHFAEHLGRCCYDGLWGGARVEEIPNKNGFRVDVVEALSSAEVGVPLLRWPGGCFADEAHHTGRMALVRRRSVPYRGGKSCGEVVVESEPDRHPRVYRGNSAAHCLRRSRTSPAMSVPERRKS